MQSEECHLLASCQRGDADAQETLVSRYQATVYRLAYSLLGHTEEALDAAQEALIAMLRSLPSFRGEARFETWVKRLTINVCLMRRRRKRTRILCDQMDEGSERPAPDPGPESIALTREVQTAVREHLHRLPTEFRPVVVLRELEGLSYAEIAEILRIPLGTVQSRLSRGRQMLRETMAADERIPTPSRGRR
jgi:RNA polymerase sigma-70 factor (ECF subfamily)